VKELIWAQTIEQPRTNTTLFALIPKWAVEETKKRNFNSFLCIAIFKRKKKEYIFFVIMILCSCLHFSRKKRKKMDF
jgi:hypothetical protein